MSFMMGMMRKRSRGLPAWAQTCLGLVPVVLGTGLTIAINSKFPSVSHDDSGKTNLMFGMKELKVESGNSPTTGVRQRISGEIDVDLKDWCVVSSDGRIDNEDMLEQSLDVVDGAMLVVEDKNESIPAVRMPFSSLASSEFDGHGHALKTDATRRFTPSSDLKGALIDRYQQPSDKESEDKNKSAVLKSTLFYRRILNRFANGLPSVSNCYFCIFDLFLGGSRAKFSGRTIPLYSSKMGKMPQRDSNIVCEKDFVESAVIDQPTSVITIDGFLSDPISSGKSVVAGDSEPGVFFGELMFGNSEIG